MGDNISGPDVGAHHKEETIRTVLGPILEDFLVRMEVAIPNVCTINPELTERVNAISKHWPDAQSSRATIDTGIYLAGTAYAHLPIEPQTQCAIYTALFVALDDPSIMRAQPPDDFTRLVLTGALKPGAGVFAELVTCVARFGQHYSRFAASAIMTSTLDAINSYYLENETQDAPIALDQDSAAFLHYLRYKTGISEAFAHFVWDKTTFPDDKEYIQAIPDISIWQSYVNDVLSFYKEEVAAEPGTYIYHRAVVEKRSRVEALQGLIDDTIALTQRIRRILGNGKARDTWEAFLRSYLGFHLGVSRYRLHEVLGKMCRIEC